MKVSNARSFLEAASAAGMPPILLGLNIDTSRMMKALKTSDDIGAIVRLHSDLDRVLKHIVRVMAPWCGRPKLQYMNQRIEHLKGAGLSEKRLAASRTINAVRNEFVHGNKECFGEADVDRLRKAIRLVLGADYTQTLLHDLTTDPYGEWDIRSLGRKGQFCLLGFMAAALVASVEHEFEKGSFRPRLPRLLRFSQIQETTKRHTLLVFLQNR
jgi:hypothetical protein